MFRFAALAFMIVAASAATAGPPEFKGVRDGIAFKYTAELQPGNNILLRGTYLDTRENFTFKVTPAGVVEGQIGFSPVAFSVDRAVRDKLAADIMAQGSENAASAKLDR